MINQKKDAWVLMARIVSMIYIFAFLVWSVKSPLQLHRPAMVILQLVFIGGLFFWRKKKGRPLFWIPDEMLVCLPYFWALANAGNAQHWIDTWKIWLAVAAVPAIINVPSHAGVFAGGIRENSLLQAVLAAFGFVVIFSGGLNVFFPNFDDDLFRASMLNLLVVAAGIPVSIASFYDAVSAWGREPEEDAAG